MSHTKMIFFDNYGDPFEKIKIGNSSQFGYTIWNYLSEKYFKKSLYLPEAEKVWNLFDKITREEQILLGTTFTRTLVKKENFLILAEVFEKFTLNLKNPENLKEQVRILKEKEQSDKISAVGWNACSVDTCFWNQRYDEETEEDILYNFKKENKHFWLFDKVSK